MLGLKLRTDPSWAVLVEGSIVDVLVDHAWCELKAATNAISIITQNPERTELVAELSVIAQEEMSHFQLVHDMLNARGVKLGRERKDEYVNALLKFMKKDGSRLSALVDRLLFAAMIEARSCERFRVLSEHLKDPELVKFYRELMISEANHFTVFLGHARKFESTMGVENRWREWIEFEDSIIPNFGINSTVHG